MTEPRIEGGGPRAHERLVRPAVGVRLGDNALKVLEKRYLQKDDRGRATETPEELFWRVAAHAASAERLYGGDDRRLAELAEKFYRQMAALEFLPNSPTLMNAGRRLGQCFACFVLPVADAITDLKDEGIFDTIRSAAAIHQTGGGTGFSFSRLRPEGGLVASTHGRASGPVSFMRVFNAATNAIHQGGFRRGANMGILRVDHPDILDFVNLKSDPQEMTNFNLSVAVTEEFLRAVRGNLKHYVVEPHTGRKLPLRDKVRDADGNVTGTGDREWTARELFDLIVRRAWESGEPGLFFVDRVNQFNPTPQLGEIEACNPCVPADTWVLTEDGPRQVRDLVGKPCVILLDGERFPSDKGFFETGTKSLVEVATKEGYRFRATPDHRVRRVSRLTPHIRDTEWVSASNLAAGDLLVLNDHRELEGWPGPGDASEGYLLGLLIGDGTLKKDRGVICVWGQGEGPDSVRAAVLKAVEGLKRRADFRGFGESLIEERGETRLCLASLGKLAARYGMTPESKQIHSLVEATGSAFHSGFLRGLFDADGSVQGRQEKGISVRLSQSNLQTLFAVQRMLLRLGIASTIYRERRPAGTRMPPDGRGGQKEYPVQTQHELVISGENIAGFHEKVGFEDVDRRLKLEGLLSVYKRALNRERFVATVESVTPSGEETVFDIRIPGANAFDGGGFHLHNCGEQSLLPWEACNLGSINLGKFVEPGGGVATATSPESRIRWKALGDAVALAVRFLDNMIDVNVYPKPQIEEIVKGNRKIGLGLMGWADMLFLLGLRYDSEAALGLARTLMRFLKEESWKASTDLARERGPFPHYAGSAYAQGHPVFNAPRPMRNAMVTTIAPTGTISILAGCSAGIEPLFSLAFVRQVLNGERLLEVHPHFKEVAEREKFACPELFDRLLEEGSCQRIAEIPALWRDIFVCAHDVSPEWHVRMQAAFQEFVDNGVSKTVNFPEHATPEDVRRVYDLAVDLGVKGVTVYRDRSRPVQPMALRPAARTGETRGRRPVPELAQAARYRYPTNLGNAYITITEDEKGPRELFTNLGKCGSDISALAEALSRVISAALGYGVPPEEIARQLLDITSQPVPYDGGWVKSLPDAVGRAILRHLNRAPESVARAPGALCPDCGAPLRFEEGCFKCTCGYSKC